MFACLEVAAKYRQPVARLPFTLIATAGIVRLPVVCIYYGMHFRNVLPALLSLPTKLRGNDTRLWPEIGCPLQACYSLCSVLSWVLLAHDPVPSAMWIWLASVELAFCCNRADPLAALDLPGLADTESLRWRSRSGIWKAMPRKLFTMAPMSWNVKGAKRRLGTLLPHKYNPRTNQC